MKKLFIVYITAFAMLSSCGDSKHSGKEPAPVLLSNANNKASCVFLTKDEKDNPIVSWTEIDNTGNKRFYFANWNVRSQQFSPGIAIPIATNTSIHEEGMPKLAVKGDGTMVAMYETSVPSEKSRFGLSDIQYTMSFDKGKTWTEHTSIQAGVQHTGSRSFGNIIRLDDGELGISWLDTNPDDAESGRPVKFARTQPSGGFGDAILIESFACQCCRTALSCDGQGNIKIVFRDLLSGSIRDISASSSADNGRTFSKAVPFSNDHWVIDGCPHNGPSVVSKNENTYVAWFTGSNQKGIFYAALDKNNNMISKRQLSPNGRFVQLCLMPDGTRMAAYNASYREGDTMYSKIMLNKIDGNGFFEKEITSPHVHASYPVIQVAGKQHVITAWTDSDKIYYTLLNTTNVTNVAPEALTTASSVKEEILFPALQVAKDPVCGMKLSDKMIGDTTVFHGKTIGFCSHGCKKIFLKEPASYALKQ